MGDERVRASNVADDDEREAHEIISLLFGVIDEGSRHFEQLAASQGLNPMQARALLYLVDPTPMRAVAEHLGCDPSYVTEIADELETRGLVIRDAAPHDRRVKLLLLTPAGDAVRSGLRKGFGASSPVMANLSSRERHQLKRLLTKMTTRGRAQTA
jgi:DNA-binding MarR family transcriptional regulator